MLVGEAGHKALEVYYRDKFSVDDAIEAGLAHIERKRDIDVKWGKNGSREDVIRRYTAGINAFFEEEPKNEGEQIAVEEKTKDTGDFLAKLISLTVGGLGLALIISAGKRILKKMVK